MQREIEIIRRLERRLQRGRGMEDKLKMEKTYTKPLGK